MIKIEKPNILCKLLYLKSFLSFYFYILEIILQRIPRNLERNVYILIPFSQFFPFSNKDIELNIDARFKKNIFLNLQTIHQRL